MIKNITQKEVNSLYLNDNYIQFVEQIEKHFYKFNIKEKFSQIVLLCIGTNKVIGDMVGPIVGEVLSKNNNYNVFEKNIIILGNLTDTLNIKNTKNVISNIYRKYENPFIITVDAALGKEEMIENIFVYSGNIEIGSSLGKSFCYYSHINIKGVVGKYSTIVQENIKTLQNANLSSVFQISSLISKGLQEAIKNINNTV